jgi:DNA-binding NarL/FixJ family response regulator
MAEPSQIVCSPALPRAAASFDHDQISIVIVDDHELLRDLLVPALRGAGDFNLVGQAEDGESAIELCQRLRPDVVILDCQLPGQQGPDVVGDILRASPRSQILMFSGTTNPLALRRALGEGARGFISKTAPLQELFEGIRLVHTGQIFCSAGIRSLMQRIMVDLPRVQSGVTVSKRERDVLAGIALGRSSKQIAAQLNLSRFTIENHRRRIMRRTGVNSVAGLTLLALELGLISLPPGVRTKPAAPLGAARSRRRLRPVAGRK